MMTFARSMVVVTLLTLLLGALVLAARPGSTTTTATADIGRQVEDDPATGTSEAEEASAADEVANLLILLQPAPSVSGEFAQASRVVLSRDPFEPTIPEPQTSDPVDPTNPGDPTGPTDPADPTDPSDPADPSDPDVDACSGDESETVCDGVVVTLDGFDAGGDAIVTVDGVSYTVAVGDEFATSFRVLALNEPCVTLLYGDEAFSICTGATVLK